MSSLNIQLLLTGNELMAGDIVDSNSAMIAQEFKELGLEIHRKISVADDLPLLIDEIKNISKSSDILIINGGLGPTIDDLTATALANAADVNISQHPDALTHIKNWCKRRNFELNEPNLKQTMLPSGCDVIPNKRGSAVGFMLSLNNCDIFCTPGVPHELKDMIREEIKPTLEKRIPNHLKTHVTRLQVFGIGESSLQKLVDEQLSDWPKEIELGFRASMPILEVKLTTRNNVAQSLKKEWIIKLTSLLGDHLVGTIDNKPKQLAEYVIDLLKNNNKKITTAESCTGGLIASNLTKIAGASQVFEAGFITYSNKMKNTLLDVNESTISEYGAVSEQTVLAMANGALKKAQANYTIAVSGIAGPDGGTEEKPVGTVWIAWGDINTIKTTCLYLPGNRQYFQLFVTAICLDLIRRELINSTETPKYIVERQKH